VDGERVMNERTLQLLGILSRAGLRSHHKRKMGQGGDHASNSIQFLKKAQVKGIKT